MRKSLTDQQVEIIIREYLNKPVKRIADEIGSNHGTIMRKLKSLGLEIPKEIIEKRKQAGLFKKGSIPFNKGKKMTEYLSEEAIKISSKTRFKKGQKPKQTKKSFEESLRNEMGLQYYYIKPPGGNMMVPKHRWLWENEKKTKIPKGYNIVFKDGNTLNCVIENLECISNKELMERNTIHQYPAEIKRTLHLTKKIKDKIKRK